MNKHLVYVGIGSNIEQEKHIRIAVQSLQESFGINCLLQVSPVYKTSAVGFEGDDFYNLVARFHTLFSPLDVEEKLKEIEHNNGRQRNQNKYSSRNLDIDLLMYDQDILHSDKISIPRDEIEKYAFVLSPLADLAPNLKHPETNRSIQEMWAEFKNRNPAETITKIEFKW
ncbi:MAG: 2-amino-4-hydroxy-6-hydroxymethyldihydropteridine diphosphokinase [gamma proteobacterium symbiont of Taylorina sp.]|nr:2-amino-4-hydroxy-6-hydroxymethyldihydropteridine diphosphokinase [gamma proteobacterium symbiont of Taylorina sp.]